MTTCAACGQPTDATICHRCTGTLRRDLLDLPALLHELDTTALRQANTGDGQGSGNGIPWNEKAREAQHAIRSAVALWARRLVPGPTIDLLPTTAHDYLALWLADRTNQVRLQPWAADCADNIRKVTAAGWRAIDRPEDRWYAGPCGADWPTPNGIQECTWTLWARLDQLQIACPQCGTSWRVDTRREWLMAAADDVWETAPNIASALTIMLRTRISASTIRYWAATGQLTPTGTRGTANLYRVGDVLTLIDRRDSTTDTPSARQDLTSA